MGEILIIVEGEADVVFLMQYLSFLQLCKPQKYKKGKPIVLEGSNKVIKIISTGGKDCIKEQGAVIEKAIDDNCRIIFIFDSDDDVSLSRNNVLTQWNKFGSSEGPEMFLLPNDRDKGTLETLLLQCIHTCNKPLLTYWQQLPGNQQNLLSELNKRYKTCGDCNARQALYGPDDKMALYSYAYQLTGNKAHETKRDYLDATVWDLQSEALAPLRDFLMKNI